MAKIKALRLKFKKGNHAGTLEGVGAGLALISAQSWLPAVGGSGINTFLGNNSTWFYGLLALLGIFALLFGIYEYRKKKPAKPQDDPSE